MESPTLTVIVRVTDRNLWTRTPARPDLYQGQFVKLIMIPQISHRILISIALVAWQTPCRDAKIIDCTSTINSFNIETEFGIFLILLGYVFGYFRVRVNEWSAHTACSCLESS